MSKIHVRKPIVGIAVTLVTCALLAGCGVSTQNQSTGNADSQNAVTNSPSSNSSNGSSPPVLKTTTQRWSTPPKMIIDTSKQYDALVHTNYGDFTIQLLAKESPITVNNFVFLAQHQFYHDDKFFRIIKSFMVQTGDPNNDGTGGPGYQFKDELPPKEQYAPGIVAMANAGPNTNGSQFFVGTGSDMAQLNSNPAYTIFGKVTKGMNVVNQIASIPVTTNPQSNEASYPLATAYIESVTIQVH